MPEGHPWLKPVRFHPSVGPRPGRVGPRGAAAARRARLLPGERRGGPRSGRGPGPRRGHRTRPLPLPVPRREGLPPGDRPGLPAPRRGAGPARRAPSLEPENGGDGRRRQQHRPRLDLLPRPGGPGGSQRVRADGPGARRGPGTGAAGQPCGRPGGARGGCGLPADRLLLRPDPGRLAEPDRRSLRQPPRPGLAEAGRPAPRPGTGAGRAAPAPRRSRPGRTPATPWNCCGAPRPS